MPQAGNAPRRIEIDVDDVLVFLRRILRVAHRAVRPPVEPVGCSFSQGWSGEHWIAKSSASSSPCRRGRVAQTAEILERAELRDGSRRGRLRCCRSRRGCRHRPARRAARCCGPCGWSCRSDGSAANTARRSPYRRIAGSRPMTSSKVPCRSGRVGCRARKQFVPGRERRLRAFDVERKGRLAAAAETVAPRLPASPRAGPASSRISTLDSADVIAQPFERGSDDIARAVLGRVPWLAADSCRPSAISTPIRLPPRA